MNKLTDTFPNIGLYTFAKELQDTLKDCNTVLDIGCGSNSPIKYIEKKTYTVGVDGFEPDLQESERQEIHSSYTVADITKLDKLNIVPGFFDAVIALDVIEHLEKKEGYKLLRDMEKLAKKKVIINTPNGFIPQYDKVNHLQGHKSGWFKHDFEGRGYKVKGMYGWKPLRGEEASIKGWPKPLWVIISVLTHYLFARNNPNIAFSLFAVKQK